MEHGGTVLKLAISTIPSRFIKPSLLKQRSDKQIQFVQIQHVNWFTLKTTNIAYINGRIYAINLLLHDPETSHGLEIDLIRSS